MHLTQEELQAQQAQQADDHLHGQGVDDSSHGGQIRVVHDHDDHPSHDPHHAMHGHVPLTPPPMQDMSSNPDLIRKFERKEVHKFVCNGKEYIRKKRVPLSQEIREKLEEAYKSGRVTRGRSARPAKVRLADELNLTLTQVNKWFDNRRLKESRQESKMLDYIDHADEELKLKKRKVSKQHEQAQLQAQLQAQQDLQQQHDHHQQQQEQIQQQQDHQESDQQQAQRAQHHGMNQMPGENSHVDTQSMAPQPPQDDHQGNSDELEQASTHPEHVHHASHLDADDTQSNPNRSRKETEAFSSKLQENNLSENINKDIARSFRVIKHYLKGDGSFFQHINPELDLIDGDAMGDRSFASRRNRRRTKVSPTMSNVLESLLGKESVLFPCVRAVQTAASQGAIKALKTLVLKSEQNFRTFLLWHIIGKYSGDREVETIMKSVMNGFGNSLQNLNVSEALERCFPELIESKPRSAYDAGNALVLSGTSGGPSAHMPSGLPHGDSSRVIFSVDSYPSSTHWAEGFLSEAFVGQKIIHENIDGEITQVLGPLSRTSKEPRFQVYLASGENITLSWDSVKPYLVSGSQWGSVTSHAQHP